jgi:N6-L-threonylcarbamoyladenine synthase/protein kinase Bud32
MRVLGIEGTAWAASAAVLDTDSGSLRIETDPYVPDSGGIHPREAAEHMAEAIPRVIETVLERERRRGPDDDSDERDRHHEEGDDDRDADGERAEDERRGDSTSVIDAVAFSRGPGLGPCLRIVASAARAFALSREVPLMGVNHMVAHAEIGRSESGFDAPICLNASGANAHILGYRNGRYRILGETMDTGVGNALDKFARHLDWAHPGGPKIEAAAEGGSYLPLPYVVKGMDFSFSGLASAAMEAIDDGEAVEDVCFSLQETVFAMLTEVAERALSLTDADELVLGGGVGQNARLQEMLETMCAERGARFFAPEPRLLRDNAGMIAALGAKMFEAGDTLSVSDSRVRPNFRPDEVVVTWPLAEPGRSDYGDHDREGPHATDTSDPGDANDPGAGGTVEDTGTVRGAEAMVEIDREAGRVIKSRPTKAYRHPALDERLGCERTVAEARLTSAARRLGVPTPVIEALDLREKAITVEHVGDADLRDLLGSDTEIGSGDSSASEIPAVDEVSAVDGDGPNDPPEPATAAIENVGRHLATLHDAGIVHGDPTTRNVRMALLDRSDPSTDPSAPSDASSASADVRRTYLIDFGLGYHSDATEDHAMDLHVFGRSLAGTTDHAPGLREAFEAAYAAVGDRTVLDRLREIEGRGRYR